MPRKNLHLSEQAVGLLKKMDNASEYVEHMVMTHMTRAIQALEKLRAAGWQSNEILAACGVLNGSWLHVHDPTWHGHSMADGQEYAGGWEVSEERWIELAGQVSTHVDLAFALDLVVAEFWTGNSYLDRCIRRGSADTDTP